MSGLCEIGYRRRLDDETSFIAFARNERQGSSQERTGAAMHCLMKRCEAVLTEAFKAMVRDAMTDDAAVRSG
jgi:hypothetical protein